MVFLFDLNYIESHNKKVKVESKVSDKILKVKNKTRNNFRFSLSKIRSQNYKLQNVRVNMALEISTNQRNHSKIVTPGFLRTVITNLVSDFQNSYGDYYIYL